MNMQSRLTRDIQRRCESGSCRSTISVRRERLYHVVVPNPRGGTMRNGGFDCPRCGHQNQIPAAQMPNGLVAQLPSRDRMLQKYAPAGRCEPQQPKILATHAAEPSWSTGPAAAELVRAAFAAARADPSRSSVFALAPAAGNPGGLTDIGAEMLKVIGNSDPIAWLDQTDCEIVVICHVVDGRRVKLVAHPTAGAASLVRDPD